MFYHLQNLFWGFLSREVWLGAFFGGFMSGGFCSGSFCPDTQQNIALLLVYSGLC